MSNEKRCENCYWEHRTEDKVCPCYRCYPNLSEWKESELSKCQRKLDIATRALEYCRGCVECADEALKEMEEV